MYDKYDKAIHERILELGAKDTVWMDCYEQSVLLRANIKDLPALSYEFS